ncbi:Claudin-6 Skullin [Triplophysa tibetana]|uniref:Claudin-6 Skullin n=1 Tax=Triplophysa tibetana TaxID=1572043 RepID=A0A5A9NTC9_9TELE|nr:Claudin-6 Skullin [Triplophysa tibetana]KAA0713354.1 Claudin-6 Skullin [Triplophysa tibetana]
MKVRGLQIWGLLLTLLGWIFVACTMAMEGWKVTSVGGQGGSSIITVGWYWSSLWRACFTDSAATSNCYDFPVLWAVEDYIQIVRALLMSGMAVGVLGFILSFAGMECTYIGGKDNEKNRSMFTGSLCHVFSAEGKASRLSHTNLSIISELSSRSGVSSISEISSQSGSSAVSHISPVNTRTRRPSRSKRKSRNSVKTKVYRPVGSSMSSRLSPQRPYREQAAEDLGNDDSIPDMSRALAVVSVILGFWAAVFALIGLKCNKIGGSELTNARIAFAAELTFMLSAPSHHTSGFVCAIMLRSPDAILTSILVPVSIHLLVLCSASSPPHLQENLQEKVHCVHELG